MPEVPQLKSCCFCLTTETGTKIIGCIFTVIGALETLGYLMELVNLLPKMGKEHATSDVFVVAVMLIFSAIITLLGIYLLLGVYKGNQAYVRLWVNVMFMAIIISTILLIIRVVLWITGRRQHDIAVNVMNLLILVYSVLVVNSYLREHGTGIETI